jgi:hypothetical protein
MEEAEKGLCFNKMINEKEKGKKKKKEAQSVVLTEMRLPFILLVLHRFLVPGSSRRC